MHKNFVGSTIEDKYLVLSVLGSGGLGTVFKAEQKGLSRLVALKLLHADNAITEDNQKRFEQEAKILASLQHKNIVGVYSFGLLDQEQPYMVIEYIEGKTLAELLVAESPLAWKRVVHIFSQICLALQCAHDHGIIHRDLKPQNIMLLQTPDPDHVKVLDFGLSKLVFGSGEAAQQKLTQTGAILGSIHYMSPEICTGNKAEPRSDIYSLGCILYECLAGRVPLDAEHPMGVLHKHVHTMPDALPDTIPTELQQITFKAIQKKPGDRFSSMKEFADALRLIDTGELNLSGIQIKKQKQSNNNLVLGVSAFFLFVLIISGVVVANRLRAQNEKEKPKIPPSSSRQAWINRAKQQVESAEQFARQDKVKQADEAANRALRTIARSYSAVILTRDFAEQDTALLIRLADVLQKTKPQNIELNRIDNLIRENDIPPLAEKDRYKLLMALSRIRGACGFFDDSFVAFLETINQLIEAGQQSKCQEIIDKQKLVEAPNEEKQFEKEAFLEAAEAVRDIAFDKMTEAKTHGLLMKKSISKLESADELALHTLYIQLMKIVAATEGEMKMYEVASEAKKNANSITIPHPDRLHDYYRELFNLELLKFRNYSKCESILAEWRKYLDGLDSSRREGRFEQVITFCYQKLEQYRKASKS